MKQVGMESSVQVEAERSSCCFVEEEERRKTKRFEVGGDNKVIYV